MKRVLIPAALMGLLLILTGCGSDSLAPHDAIPELTADASAQQAGLVAYAVATVGPLAVTYGNKSEIYTFPPGDIAGSVELDYRTGGAGGAPSTPDDADWVAMSTLGDNGLVITTPLGGEIFISAEVTASITRGTPDSATVQEGSHGSLVSGDYHADFTIGAVTVYDTGYPSGGPVVFDNGYHELEISFNGTRFADLSLDGLVRWTFDLDTMDLAEVD